MLFLGNGSVRKRVHEVFGHFFQHHPSHHLYSWAGLFEAGLRDLKKQFSLILFAYNFMTGYSKKIKKIIRDSAFNKKKKKPGFKLTLGQR